MFNKLTKKQKELIPKIRSQENKKDPKVYAKFFLGSWTWFITEFDGKDEMFGFVVSDLAPYGEFGSIYLSELESIKVNGMFEVDREIYQVNPREPKLLSVILKEDGIKR